MNKEEELKLSMEAAIAFPTADTFKHKDARGPGSRIGLYCTKCKVEYTRENDELGKLCTVPDPLPLDWATAMRLRDECVAVRFKPLDDKGFWWKDACKAIYRESKYFPHMSSEEFWRDYATPADYIRAAIRAKAVE